MAFRKNKKRIDPRYFLHETTYRDLEERLDQGEEENPDPDGLLLRHSASWPGFMGFAYGFGRGEKYCTRFDPVEKRLPHSGRSKKRAKTEKISAFALSASQGCGDQISISFTVLRPFLVARPQASSRRLWTFSLRALMSAPDDILPCVLMYAFTLLPTTRLSLLGASGAGASSNISLLPPASGGRSPDFPFHQSQKSPTGL